MKEKKIEKPDTGKIITDKKIVIEKKQTGIFRQAIPHIVALLVFVFVNLLFFSPMVLDNKMIRQSDIIQYKSVSKEINDYYQRTGKSTLWTNAIFGGMPTFQIGVKYEGNLLQYLEKVAALGFPHPSQLLLFAFIGFYLLLILMRVNPWLAIGGALAYGLGSYNLILLEAGHTSKLHAIGLLPLAVAGILLLRQGRFLWGSAITAVALSLQIYANHLQITYYLMLLMVIYGIVELVAAIRQKQFNNLWMAGGLAVVCALFAVLSNLSNLWSTYEYLPSTIRGPAELTSNEQSSGGLDKDYAMSWSYGKMETMTLLIPDFNGGASNAKMGANTNLETLLRQYQAPPAQITSFLDNAPMYWGDQPFTSGPVYVGALVCLLFLLGMLVIREHWKWWILSATILAVLLSWGKNFEWFSDIFFYYLPGYNKFRVVSMILVLVGFTFPFMGFMMLSKMVNGEFDKAFLFSRLKISVYVTGGLCLLFAVAGPALFNFQGPGDGRMQKEIIDAIIEDRKSLLRADAIRSLVFILLGAGLIWAYIKNRINQNILIAGIVLLVFFDLFTVVKRYLDNDDFIPKNEYARYFEPTQVDQLIQKETSKDYRVFNLGADPTTDSRTSYYHKSLGGYSAVKLRRYQDIIEHQLTKSDSTKNSGFPFNKDVVDMLNTKYIIFKSGEQDQVLPNTAAMDNAWFVKNVKMVNNADEEMNGLNDFNPAETVLIDKRFSDQLTGFQPAMDSAAVIVLKSYEPNNLIYTSSSKVEQVAVFSEIYYQPGWDAFVDGKPVNHFRCNYILRGMRLPAGEHTIEFKFEPVSYYTGEKIAMAGSGMILLFLFGLIGKEFLKRKSE
ncbi:MAG TPA: YfhO family protein [Chitinophagales bacterium]|nr:YfhO family protein [Chitinophagales bacterium]